MANNWYVITGGPSAGKTTLINVLERLGHAVIPEAARTYIDEQISKGLTIEQIRADEQQFQHEILKLKQKNETNHDPSLLTFFDRGMQDSVAYLRYFGFELQEWVLQHMYKFTYKNVFLLEPLPIFENDYARTEGPGSAEQLYHLLHDAYKTYGMNPVVVPVMPPEERAEFVLSHVMDDQAVRR